MKKLLEIILTPFRLLKDLFVLLWSRKLTRAAIIIAIVVLGIHMYITLSPHWSKKDNEVPTSSEASTEMTTTATTSVPSTEAVTQVAKATVATVAPEQVTTTAKTATIKVEKESPVEEGNVDDETITENGSITIFQGNGSYTVSCRSDLYEAAFYATYPPVDGRDLLIQIPDDVKSISVAYSIRNTDKNLLELSDFEELVLERTENGTEAQYSIPDNPLRSDGGWPLDCPSFYGVFRLETTDGFEYFSISY